MPAALATPPSTDAALSPPAALSAQACPGSAQFTQAQADKLLRALRQNLPGTAFESAWPSCVPGLLAVRMQNGQVAYADKSARYLVLGLVFDSATGAALDQQMDSTTPSKP